MRYLGQAHETSVPHEPGEPWDVLSARFHRLHAQRNGFSRPEDPVEAVTVRAKAVGNARAELGRPAGLRSRAR